MRPKQRVLFPTDSRAPRRRGKHGLTPRELDSLLAAQGFACGICGTPDPGPAGWSIDHSHALARLHNHSEAVGCRRCVRGVLCNDCNLLLGRAKDDPAILRAAAAYVEARR